MIELLMMLWFFVLPLIGIFAIILAPVFWFFVVPQISRSLTWARFQNVILHFIADDAGTIELVKSKEFIAEGIVRTKRGWRFLPRPDPEGSEPDIERMALKIYTLRGHGKPTMLGYAGKVTSMNPPTLASMQQDEKTFDPVPALKELLEEIGDLPGARGRRRYLKGIVNKCITHVKARKVTNLDLSQVKSALEGLYPPTLIDALAENRILKGMKKRGKELMPWILGGAIIIGVVIIGVVAILSI